MSKIVERQNELFGNIVGSPVWQHVVEQACFSLLPVWQQTKDNIYRKSMDLRKCSFTKRKK